MHIGISTKIVVCCFFQKSEKLQVLDPLRRHPKLGRGVLQTFFGNFFKNVDVQCTSFYAQFSYFCDFSLQNGIWHRYKEIITLKKLYKSLIQKNSTILIASILLQDVFVYHVPMTPGSKLKISCNTILYKDHFFDDAIYNFLSTRRRAAKFSISNSKVSIF